MKSGRNKWSGGKKPQRDNPKAGIVVKPYKQFLSPWLCGEAEKENKVNELATMTGKLERTQGPREIISGN